jgi:hypothetical protein
MHVRSRAREHTLVKQGPALFGWRLAGLCMAEEHQWWAQPMMTQRAEAVPGDEHPPRPPTQSF